MTDYDVLLRVLRLVGLSDLADDYEGGSSVSADDGTTVRLITYCIYATAEEIARYYLPMKCVEELSSEDGVYLLSNFKNVPLRILGVRSGGKAVPYTVDNDRLLAPAGKIEVEFFYAQRKRSIVVVASDEDPDGQNVQLVNGRIVSFGAAADYALMVGEASMAEILETRYREALDRAMTESGYSKYIPPRRWV